MDFKRFHDTMPEPNHLHHAGRFSNKISFDSRAECRRGTVTTTLAEETEEDFTSDDVFNRSNHSSDGASFV